MFDPKQLLEAITASAAKPASATPGQGGLGDLLGQILGGAKTHQSPDVRHMTAEAQQQQQQGGLGEVLGGLLGKLQGQQNAPLSPDQPRQAAPGGLGNIGDVLGNIFGQAKEGVKEGAGRMNEATGAGQKIDDLLRQVTGGQASGDMIAKVKELIGNNPLTAGAVLGGLGALVGGTKTGRSLAFDAAKIGGLVLIGGLAYKAWQNHQAGKPLFSGRDATPQKLAVAAPDGSGFEETAQSNENALLYLRAMIAAAAADGEVDEEEFKRITGNLEQLGFNEEARGFLEQEFQQPASPEKLAQAASSPEVGAQVYTAARLAIEPDTAEERAWLAALAGSLSLDAGLQAQIDAAARGVKA
ncbi:MAG: tellurite resistance TerB family protein [Hyphomicrobiaceae bacterium]|nr:MAG: tellurite resistance TerB family protein [Hyphomicrobiaceae bacterium]